MGSKNKRLTIEEVRDTATAKGGRFLSEAYNNSQTRYWWECASGHRWQATANKIRQGGWCPNCSDGIGEELTRLCFQRVFRKTFPKSRPHWLRLDPSHSQELDGYNAQLAVAFEHQGRQHYARYRDFFHKSVKRYQRGVSLDRRKHRLCRQHGIRLVKIPEVGWKFPLERLLPEVIRRCRQRGIRVPAGAEQRRINYAPAWNMNRQRAEKAMRELKKVSKKRGGKLLDSQWMGDRWKYHFKCGCGHQWRASAGNIFQGQWCPRCMVKIIRKKAILWWRGVKGKKMRERLYRQGQRHLVGLKRFAKKMGGECLSTEWLGERRPYKFRCGDCGRKWETFAGNILTHRHWCSSCSQREKWAKVNRQRNILGKMQQVAIKRGGRCLSRKWLGALANYRFRCGDCGREWETKPSIILDRGGWCRSCSHRKRHARNRAERLSPTSA